MNSTEDTTYMACILQKLWPKTDLKQVPDIWIAYATSTSEILLNPSIPTIQISEAKMKPRLKKYLKVAEKIIDNIDEIFLSDIGKFIIVKICAIQQTPFLRRSANLP